MKYYGRADSHYRFNYSENVEGNIYVGILIDVILAETALRETGLRYVSVSAPAPNFNQVLAFTEGCRSFLEDSVEI